MGHIPMGCKSPPRRPVQAGQRPCPPPQQSCKDRLDTFGAQVLGRNILEPLRPFTPHLKHDPAGPNGHVNRTDPHFVGIMWHGALPPLPPAIPSPAISKRHEFGAAKIGQHFPAILHPSRRASLPPVNARADGKHPMTTACDHADLGLAPVQQRARRGRVEDDRWRHRVLIHGIAGHCKPRLRWNTA